MQSGACNRLSRALALLSLLCALELRGTVVHPIDLATLTAGADVIAVGQVKSISPEGQAYIEVAGTTITASRLLATLRVDHILKGGAPSGELEFAFLVPDSPLAYQNIPQGQFGIFFLKKTTMGWTVLDPVYPFIPAVPTSPPSRETALDQVTRILGQALVSRDLPDGGRFRILDALASLKTPLAAETLREAMGRTTGELSLLIAARLVSRNDLAGLPAVKKALLQPTEISRHTASILSGSLQGLKDERAVPTLTKLLAMNDSTTRLSIVIALRQTGSHAALRPLSGVLSDNDIFVRYHAVVGMGEITREDEWTPAFEEFQSREGRYLSHWRSWASVNLR